jgi:hypothetical protein
LFESLERLLKYGHDSFHYITAVILAAVV